MWRRNGGVHRGVVTAAEISSEINRTLSEGRSLAIISLLVHNGRSVDKSARLLVEEGGNWTSGTLGDSWLDDLAIRHAISLIAGENTEIAVAGVSELTGEDRDRAVEMEMTERVKGLRLLFEISRPPLELVICGGGHVGQAVARAGRLLDFIVTVIDDRADFASREKFPDPEVRLITDEFTAALRSLKIVPVTHIVIVTRGHRHDEICLREVIDKPARYIGMIGSRRRTTTIREHLRREGVAADLLHRIH
ncbi:MAG: XdhC family protein, partial [Acidobacteria bacterium]|nr:XdhC family protein [Acidobacteriota bacterium]